MTLSRCQLRVSRLLPLCLFLFAFPATAQAHTSVQGLGEFVSGLLHPLTTPAHVLILLGLGLFLGQQSPLSLKRPLLVFAPLSAAALLLTTTGLITTVYPPVLICIALAATTLVALEKTPPPFACITLFAAAAIGIGFDSAVEKGTALAVIKTLFGTWISLIIVLCDIAFYVSLLVKKKWQRVGIRVAGSWIIAISLLVLAFSLRK